MEAAESVEEFLAAHKDADLLPNGKIRCAVTGHELPPKLPLLHAHWSGKTYRKQKQVCGYDFEQHLPWIVPHTKDPHLLYCTLTRRPISRQPKTLEGHVKGAKFQRLLALEKERQRRESEEQERTDAGISEAACEGEDGEDDEDWEVLEDMVEVCGADHADDDGDPASGTSAGLSMEATVVGGEGKKHTREKPHSRRSRGYSEGQAVALAGTAAATEEEEEAQHDGEDDEERFWLLGKRAAMRDSGELGLMQKKPKKAGTKSAPGSARKRSREPPQSRPSSCQPRPKGSFAPTRAKPHAAKKEHGARVNSTRKTR